MTRKEDERLLRGAGHFVDDVEAAGTLHIAVAAARTRTRGSAHRRVTRRGRVRRASVLTGADVVARTRAVPRPAPAAGRPATPASTRLATDVARFEGQPVVSVVAVDRYVAEDALELIDVDYEPLPHVTDVEAGSRPARPGSTPAVRNLLVAIRGRAGDPEARCAAAAVVVDGRSASTA